MVVPGATSSSLFPSLECCVYGVCKGSDDQKKTCDVAEGNMSQKTSSQNWPIYIVPERRYPPIASHDTVFLRPGCKITAKRGQAIFITDDQCVQVFPMTYLTSPFKVESWLKENVIKQKNALAVTKNNKHIILQQAQRGCVAACVGMLSLDHHKQINIQSIIMARIATEKKAMQLFRDAKLNPIAISLNQIQDLKILEILLKRNGPGILSITHPDLGGHCIILDEISNGYATIRDPYHGWMIQVNAKDLMSWISYEFFIQIK